MGQQLANAALKESGRPSVVTFILGGITLAACVLMTCTGVYELVLGIARERTFPSSSRTASIARLMTYVRIYKLVFVIDGARVETRGAPTFSPLRPGGYPGRRGEAGGRGR